VFIWNLCSIFIIFFALLINHVTSIFFSDHFLVASFVIFDLFFSVSQFPAFLLEVVKQGAVAPLVAPLGQLWTEEDEGEPVQQVRHQIPHLRVRGTPLDERQRKPAKKGQRVREHLAKNSKSKIFLYFFLIFFAKINIEK
jgi:hypothetical protein